MGDRHLDSQELARKIVDLASDKQAIDTVMLDMIEVCSFTDYFVICSGESKRQLQAIADGILKELSKEKIKPNHQEGDADSGWILLDFGDVIVHIFGSYEREYFRLDQLWENATTKVRMP
jgi:ribosome-associated protein